MFTSRTIRAAATTAVAAALLLSSACGGSDDNSDKPDATTTTSASANGDDGATTESTEELPTTTLSPEQEAENSTALLAWIDESTAQLEAATDACEVVELTVSEQSLSPTDEAGARAAGKFFAQTYRRLGQLTEGLTPETREAIAKLADEIEAEATADDLDVAAYVDHGPTMLANEEYVAAQTELNTRLGAQCAAE